MLRGERIGLRARVESDVPVLHEELYDDVLGRSRADTRPWQPTPVGFSPYAVNEPKDGHAEFTVVELTTNEVVGEAIVWGIDSHNRLAHLGLALRPAFRGRGYGAESVRLMCHYIFTVRGFQRAQLETLADNAPMIRAAESAGFVREGLLRRNAWVYGEWLDEVILGLLAEDWAKEK
ncbi:RimJ/RimL family protein N-acetyltransferase [Kitasatospora gansuensis]|uniref:RimJ/RimL family protein N-acetyltransferase n=1 Tax=Kitasatospora gansuensis TaxID=258050 RepID=A0A7W7S8U4_9ACTN|nr:GNAT family protein [Kitasatospora gansuensis]MBB4945607.1 RimJ/RimL family protein N-acetyltransferase [Kitasatospora gansuensis]